eukprot:RCo002366
MKEMYDQTLKERAEEVEAVQRQWKQALDVKQDYDALLESELSEKEKRRQQLREMEAKYHSMKADHDQGVVVKQKAEHDLSLQAEKTATMKQMYDDLKEGYDQSAIELDDTKKALEEN